MMADCMRVHLTLLLTLPPFSFTSRQHLVEKIIRLRIYESRYWKEDCFALTGIASALALAHNRPCSSVRHRFAPVIDCSSPLSVCFPVEQYAPSLLPSHSFPLCGTATPFGIC